MITSSCYEKTIKVLGNKIITILGLERRRLFNAVSVHGADLLKVINDSEYTSFNLNDAFIVFALEEDGNEYYILKEEDGTMSSISKFKMALKIYGNGCHDISQKLLTAFKEVGVLQEMYDNGLYIQNLTYPKFVHEPINNVMWSRCDIDINLKIRFNYQGYDDNKTFNTYKNEINEMEIQMDEISHITPNEDSDGKHYI